jgi:hypothetical protein
LPAESSDAGAGVVAEFVYGAVIVGLTGRTSEAQAPVGLATTINIRDARCAHLSRRIAGTGPRITNVAFVFADEVNTAVGAGPDQRHTLLERAGRGVDGRAVVVFGTDVRIVGAVQRAALGAVGVLEGQTQVEFASTLGIVLASLAEPEWLNALGGCGITHFAVGALDADAGVRAHEVVGYTLRDVVGHRCAGGAAWAYAFVTRALPSAKLSAVRKVQAEVAFWTTLGVGLTLQTDGLLRCSRPRRNVGLCIRNCVLDDIWLCVCSGVSATVSSIFTDLRPDIGFIRGLVRAAGERERAKAEE